MAAKADTLGSDICQVTGCHGWKKRSARGASMYMYTILAIFGHTVNFLYGIGQLHVMLIDNFSHKSECNRTG